jgi:hypothetical protein
VNLWFVLIFANLWLQSLISKTGGPPLHSLPPDIQILLIKQLVHREAKMLSPPLFSLEILNLSAEYQDGIQAQPARLKQSIERGIVDISSDQD